MIKLKLVRFDPITFLRKNLKDRWTPRIPLGRRLKFWLKGYYSEHILLFDLEDGNDNWRHYIPDLYRYRITHRTNLHVWIILHDKLIFDSFMRSRLPIVAALFALHQGRFVSCGEGWDADRLVDALKGGAGFVLKAAQGGTGIGLLFLNGNSNGAMVNGKPHSEEEVRALLKTLAYHVCYPLMTSHPAIRQVFPHSVNALRVTAFVGNDGLPRLLAPVFCIGTSESAPVEHFCNGGLVAQVDENTGRCIKCMRHGSDGRLEYITDHPDTLTSIVGFEIPFWQEIRKTILDFHAAHPGFDLVGWDVLVAPDRFYIIEGNHNPGLRIPLMNRNLGNEPEFRGFLEERGILNRSN